MVAWNYLRFDYSWSKSDKTRQDQHHISEVSWIVSPIATIVKGISYLNYSSYSNCRERSNLNLLRNSSVLLFFHSFLSANNFYYVKIDLEVTFTYFFTRKCSWHPIIQLCYNSTVFLFENSKTFEFLYGKWLSEQSASIGKSTLSVLFASHFKDAA